MTRQNVFVVVSILCSVLGANSTGNSIKPICTDDDSDDSIPLVSQLSTTFMNGSWYEHVFTSPILTNDSCSYFDFRCFMANSSCHVRNQVWKTYVLDEIWSGYVTEENGKIRLEIGPLLILFNVKFMEDAMLIWNCNNQTLDFASVLIRIDTDENMDQAWKEASKNMKFLPIMEPFPVNKWQKSETIDCAATNNFAHHLPPQLFITAITIFFVTILQ